MQQAGPTYPNAAQGRPDAGSTQDWQENLCPEFAWAMAAVTSPFGLEVLG